MAGFGPDEISTLIAKKKYAQAIEAIKAKLKTGRPDPRLRMQLADVLILAGKGKEAVTILLPIADEFAKEGFAAKAISVLKKIQKIEPGRRDIDTRLASLIEEKQKHATVTMPSPSSGGGGFELGIEEIGFEAAAPSRAAAAPAPRPAPAPPRAPIAMPEIGMDDGPELSIAPPARPAPPPRPAAPPPPAPAPPAPRPAPPPPAARPAPAPPRAAAPPAPRPAPPRPAPPPPPPPPPPPKPAPAPVEDRDFEGISVEPEPEPLPLEPEPEPPMLDLEPEPLVVEPEPVLEPEPEPEPILLAPEPEPEPEPAAAPAADEFNLAQDAGPEFDLDGGGGEDFDLAAVDAAAAEPEPEISLEPEPVADEPMSDAAFGDELVSVLDDMFQNITSGADDAPSGAPEAGPSQIVVSPLFKDFSVDEMVMVIAGLKLLTFDKGQVILREGDPGNSMYMLTSGVARAFVKKTGKQVKVGDLEEGAFFGEVSILTGKPRMATVVALDACELLELDRPTLDSITKTHPHVRNVLQEFADQRMKARG